MGRSFGPLAAAFAWVGWFSVSPAFGSPSVGPAAMFNRVFAPRSDAGHWLGWALLFIVLGLSILVYVGIARRGIWRANILSGLIYGAACWLLAGTVVMPLLGLADPFPVPAPPAVPDPMHGTLMMLHLGIGAPLTSLVAWLVFGVVLGATAAWRPDLSRGTWAALFGAAAAAAIAAAAADTLAGFAPAASAAGGARTVATGPVNALPEGPLFISVFRLPQPAGATLGPHAHLPGFAWSLRGVETMTFADAPMVRVGPGQGGFMGAQQSHTHLNIDDRVPAGAVAVLIVLTGAVVAMLSTSLRMTPVGMSAALLFLIALGALAAWNPWSNDWLFVSVRPASARGGSMPLPTASRVFESPDLVPLPAGPYVETVREVTLEPGPETTIRSVGATLLLVLEGQARVQLAGPTDRVMGRYQAMLLQPGSSAQIASVGDRGARVLEFTIEPRSGASRVPDANW